MRIQNLGVRLTTDFLNSEFFSNRSLVPYEIVSKADAHEMNQLPLQSETKVSRILVVDDIADNCFLLQALLEAEGYQVEMVDSGYAALKMVEANPPDLILLDVMMPQMNGFEVTRRIRQNSRLPFIPILLITGYQPVKESEAFDTGANGLLYKPLNLDRLLEQVRANLQRKLWEVKE